MFIIVIKKILSAAAFQQLESERETKKYKQEIENCVMLLSYQDHATYVVAWFFKDDGMFVF